MKLLGSFGRHIRKSGFSLIELLVAISILSILSTLVIIDFTHTKKVARDARRKSDVTTLTAAMNKYALTNTSHFVREEAGCSTPEPGNDKCTGAGGASFGKMNMPGGETSGSNLYATPIMQVLFNRGYLSVLAQDPFAKRNSKNDRKYDYVLMRCNSDWTQAFNVSDTYFAVWAGLELPASEVEKDNTARMCGGNIAAARPDPDVVYKFGYNSSQNDSDSRYVTTKNARTLAQANKCFETIPAGQSGAGQYTQTDCPSASATPTTSSPSPTCTVSPSPSTSPTPTTASPSDTPTASTSSSGGSPTPTATTDMGGGNQPFGQYRNPFTGIFAWIRQLISPNRAQAMTLIELSFSPTAAGSAVPVAVSATPSCSPSPSPSPSATSPSPSPSASPTSPTPTTTPTDNSGTPTPSVSIPNGGVPPPVPNLDEACKAIWGANTSCYAQGNQ